MNYMGDDDGEIEKIIDAYVPPSDSSRADNGELDEACIYAEACERRISLLYGDINEIEAENSHLNELLNELNFHNLDRE